MIGSQERTLDRGAAILPCAYGALNPRLFEESLP